MMVVHATSTETFIKSHLWIMLLIFCEGCKVIPFVSIELPCSIGLHFIVHQNIILTAHLI